MTTPSPFEPLPYTPGARRFDAVLTLRESVGFQILRLDGGDIDATNRLADWIMVSLFSWGRAADDDAVQPGADRQGWWGAEVAAEGLTGAWGSRLWTVQRAALTLETVRRVRELIAEALAWIVTDGIASAVNVSAARVDNRRVRVDVSVVRGDHELLAVRFADVWAAIQGGANAA